MDNTETQQTRKAHEPFSIMCIALLETIVLGFATIILMIAKVSGFSTLSWFWTIFPIPLGIFIACFSIILDIIYYKQQVKEMQNEIENLKTNDQ